MSSFLKLNNAANNKFINCDNVVNIQAAISGSGATAVATVNIVYNIPTAAGEANEGGLLQTIVTYAAPGTSNEYTGFTAATLQSHFEDAIMEMQNPEAKAGKGNYTGFKVLSSIVGVKVTATDAPLTDAVPTITQGHTANLA